jgi:hypothetical protein
MGVFFGLGARLRHGCGHTSVTQRAERWEPIGGPWIKVALIDFETGPRRLGAITVVRRCRNRLVERAVKQGTDVRVYLWPCPPALRQSVAGMDKKPPAASVKPGGRKKAAGNDNDR